MGIIRRSTVLFSQSWSVLRSNPTLAAFPVIAGVAQLAILASFAGAIVVSGGLPRLMSAISQSTEPGQEAALDHAVAWPLVALFYFVAFFVQTFFTTALIGAALEHFAGRPASVGAGLRAAAARLPQILGWSLLNASIGLILQAIAERVGFVGAIVVRLVGFGWSIATYFTIPVLAAEGVGPITAVRRSVEVLRRRWGEALVLNIGVSAVLTMGAGLVSAGIIMIAFTATVAIESPVPIAIGIALVLAVLLVASVLSATILGVIRAALYRFAMDEAAPRGFDADALKQAFRLKSKTPAP